MCFVTALSLAMEHGCRNTKLHLKINVRFSKTVKVEIITSNSKRNRSTKICIIQLLHPKVNTIPTPPCLIHNPHNAPHPLQVSSSSFNFVKGCIARNRPGFAARSLSAKIRCPRYCMCLLKKQHFSNLSFSPAALSLMNISSKCSKCSFSELL